jgi:hypothetical protein
MIMQNIVLIAAIAAPVALLLLLRSNAAIVFLSLCAGALLVRYVGDDAGLVGSAVGNNSALTGQYFQIVLLLLPAALSTLFTMRSMRGAKLIINLLPALAVGFVGVILTVPLLPGGVQHNITSLNGWSILDHNKQIIVAAGVLVSLAVLWLVRPSHHKKRHH